MSRKIHEEHTKNGCGEETESNLLIRLLTAPAKPSTASQEIK